jgi:hypothetical protein
MLLTGIAQAAETKTSEAEKTRFLLRYPHLAQLKTLEKPDEFPLQRLYETRQPLYLTKLFATITRNHKKNFEEYELYTQELERLIQELEPIITEAEFKRKTGLIKKAIANNRDRYYPLSLATIMKKYPHLAQLKDTSGVSLLQLFVDNPKKPGLLLTLSSKINTQYSRNAQEYLVYLEEMNQLLNVEASGRAPQTLINQLRNETEKAIAQTELRVEYPHLYKLTLVTPEDDTFNLLHEFQTASTGDGRIQAVRFMLQEINQLTNAAEFERYAEELKRLTKYYYLGDDIKQEISASIANKQKQLYGSSSSSAASNAR